MEEELIRKIKKRYPIENEYSDQDKDILQKLQKELKNLKINKLSKIDNTQDDIDMPEITEIPIKTVYINKSLDLEKEVPLEYHDRIKEILIDNAIKTEKTMLRYFDNLHIHHNNNDKE